MVVIKMLLTGVDSDGRSLTIIETLPANAVTVPLRTFTLRWATGRDRDGGLVDFTPMHVGLEVDGLSFNRPIPADWLAAWDKVRQKSQEQTHDLARHHSEVQPR